MNDYQLIRESILHPEKYNRCKITPPQMDIIRYISKERVVDSSGLSAALRCTVHSASQRLACLSRKRVLIRIGMPDPTGGNYYNYSLPAFVKKALAETSLTEEK